ncbi:MAG TPA: pyruvate kinase [Verrucomicrobiae bacterium]|nr:pyruvate kinase [Verrucomicrobiae bacterium]
MNDRPDEPQKESKNWKVPQVMATVGPTLEKGEDLKRAMEAGAAWFRLPCGYRQRPHLENALAVRKAAQETGTTVQLLLDLPSSRPRTGNMTELRLNPGDRVLFWDPELTAGAPEKNGALVVPLPGLAELMDKLVPQQRMWFCDGRLNFVVDELLDAKVMTHMVHGTVPLKSSNSLFLPDSPSPFSAITPLDTKLLRTLVEGGVRPDWIALSLIASPDDVREARAAVTELMGEGVKMMAKFETIAALEVAEEIIDVADGIMVARGDLGLAVGYIRLPEAQENLVALARKAGKATVVATQVLEAFSETGLPQRAELSDLSLVARQRADAVMLGKETVFSPRPIECIRLAREVLTYETRRFEKAGNRPKRAKARTLTS